MGDIILTNDDGTSVEVNRFGLLISQRSLHRGVHHMLTFEDLYFASRVGREYANHMIIDCVKSVNSNFFEEV